MANLPNMDPKKNPMPTQEPQVRAHNFSEVALGYSEETANLIDQEVSALIDQAYAQCRDILTHCRRELEITAQYLLDHETMDGAVFAKVFASPDAEEFAPYQRLSFLPFAVLEALLFLQHFRVVAYHQWRC